MIKTFILQSNQMNAIDTIIEIVKIILPAIVVFFTAYYLLKQQSEENLTKAKLEINRNNQNLITPIKLQAYERLVLLLERISPQQLILEHNEPDLNAFKMKHLMINHIQQEFNYNLSQQVYISQQSWQIIKVVKEQVIQLINASYEELPSEATSNDLHKKIIEKLIASGEQPTEKALMFIKAEAALNFG